MISMYEASGTPTESMLFTSAKLTFFVSLLSIWIMGALITTVVYFKGNWRKKIPTFGSAENG